MHNCSHTIVGKFAADGFNGISKISIKFNPQAGLSDPRQGAMQEQFNVIVVRRHTPIKRKLLDYFFCCTNSHSSKENLSLLVLKTSPYLLFNLPVHN
jgi:hypothetical protein